MEKYKFDFTTKTLTISKAFAEKALNATSKEYQLILQLQSDFPNLTIVRKTHKSPKKYHTKEGEVYNCNQFKNLTYENMERFINALPEGENKKQVLETFNFLRDNIGFVQPNAYKVVREWFVKQFPLYRKNPLFYLKNDVNVVDIKDLTEEQENAKSKGFSVL